ncbi:MAG: transporter [Candidatus Eisenbacteria sp.]|nr:transporter [Candidatus Eisenbacteria bacterium]
MRRAIKLLLPVVVVFAIAPAARALPIVGASANTIPARRFMIDTWGTWQDFTVSWQGDGNGGSGWIGFTEERKWTTGSLVPRVYYGVTDRLTVRAALPLEDRYREYDFDGPIESATGLGDIVIDPKFQIFRAERGYPRVAALAGVRFPTGDTGGDGTPPLSDGSTDYMLGGVISHKEGSITAHACVTYWMNGEREDGTDVTDLIVGLASIETPLDGSWNLLWEFKGVYSETPSEFHRTYVCPGIMWSGDHMNIGLSALVSMSAKGKVGISTLDYDWAPYLRIYYRFF